MFKQVTIADYNTNIEVNEYIISKCNKYTLRLNSIIQNVVWKLGEDKLNI